MIHRTSLYALGIYTVSLTVSGEGGTDTETKVEYITVYEPVSAAFSATPVSGIAPLNVEFTNTSTGDYSTCSWDFGDGGSSAECIDPSHQYTSSGVFTVSLTVSGDGGSDTETKVDYITVYEPVTSAFSATPVSGIAPLNVDFTNTSTGDYSTCSWDFGDGGSSSDCNDPSHQFAASGIYTVSLTVSGDGGSDTETKVNYITVYEPVTAAFNATPTSGLAPLNVSFTNTSTGDFDTCSWDFGDGGTSSECDNPDHTFNASGLYTVSLTVNGNGGSDTETKFDYIDVSFESLANFSGTPTSGVAPLNVDFTNLSSGDFDTCTWNFGDGGTSNECNDPSHIFGVSGIYTVSLTVNGAGGSDVETKADYITVYEPVTAAFSGNPTSGIAPLNVSFTNSSTGDYDTCSWDFGDGGTSNVCNNPAHNYTSPGIYTISLTVSGDGGSDVETKADYITVYEPVTAAFSGNPTSGIAPLNVSFTNSSTGDFDTCSWDFGDGGTSNVCNNPAHNYTSPGIYTISLTVSGDGGSDVETKADYITVYEPVTAAFSGNPTSGIAPLNVSFTNSSTGDFDTCSWDFGDGGTSNVCNNPAHNYTNPGIYTVSLTVSGDGGSDVETKADYITVYQPVTAAFSGNPTSGIAPLNVSFTNSSTGDFDTCSWDFGDGGTSNVCNNPAHNYTNPGTYTVSLTVTGNGGSDPETKTSYIVVYQEAVSDFSASPTVGIAPLLVSFTNNSSGDYDSCSWDFGDGATSTNCSNPSHNYTSGGVFTVSLTVTGNGGSDTRTKVDLITVYTKSTANFSANPMYGFDPLDVNFTNLSTGDYDTCLWDFGDGATSNTCGNPSHTYMNLGEHTVSLTVNGDGGESTETKVDFIIVYQSAFAQFSAAQTEGINSLFASFTNQSGGNISDCTWDFGDGVIVNTCSNQNHLYASPGFYTVALTITADSGVDTEIKVDYIKVYTQASASFSASPLVGPAPLNVSFTNNSSGDYDTCEWDFGDGTTSTICNPSHTYNSAGNFTVTLDISGKGGNSSSEQVNYITVIAAAVANFSGTPTQGLPPLTVNFTNTSTGVYDTCQWDFGDGSSTVASCSNQEHTYTTSGLFTVTLSISGDGGEDSEIKVGYISASDKIYFYIPLMFNR